MKLLEWLNVLLIILTKYVISKIIVDQFIMSANLIIYLFYLTRVTHVLIYSILPNTISKMQNLMKWSDYFAPMNKYNDFYIGISWLKVKLFLAQCLCLFVLICLSLKYEMQQTNISRYSYEGIWSLSII